jgi:hypothetical protein
MVLALIGLFWPIVRALARMRRSARFARVAARV